MVEHILDYLPHRDTLLHMRLVCRDVNAKVSRRFAKAYFDEPVWRLSATSTKSIVRFANCPDIASNITTIRLIAPPCRSDCYENNSKGNNYDNIWTAKNIDPIQIAKAFSLCTQADTLTLSNFRGYYEDSENFLSPFAQNLYLPKLKDFTLPNAKIHSETVILLQQKHSQTLENVKYHGVELINKMYKHKAYLKPTSWANVLVSMESFKNNCSIHICAPDQVEGWTSLAPPWDNWHDANELDDEGTGYQYMGWTIQGLPDEDDEGLLDIRLEINIKGDTDWWKGVKRLASYVIFWAEDDEDNYAEGLEMYDDQDEFWDEFYDNEMFLQAIWASEAKKFLENM